MLKDVTFGQYYPASSFAHSSDPRSKLVFLIGYIVAIFMAENFYALGVCAVMLVVAVCLSSVPLSSLLRSIKGVLFLLVFTAILNLFFYRGDTTIVVFGVPLEWGFIRITWEGVIFMVFFLVRIFLLVLSSALLTLTTTPVNLTDGIESLLTPLKWIHFPVHELALIMSIALRFIPTLMDETDRIMNAQKARGANFEDGNPVRRIKALIPVLVPLLVSSFRRAEELGDAMEARCYSGSKVRTKYKKLKFGWRDMLILFALVCLIVAVVFANLLVGNGFLPYFSFV